MVLISESIVVRIGRDVHSLNTMDFIKREIALKFFMMMITSIYLFMSTNMTVFETKMLQSLNAEILLGQLTYRQKSDIYNYCHGYDSSTKQGPIQTSHYEDYR